MTVIWLSAVVVLSTLQSLHGNTFNVDMERTSTCTVSEPVPVNQYDIFNIYASPVQDGIAGTRDRCTIKFVTTTGTGNFKLYIRELIFRECQVFVKMYDGDMNLNNARYSFGCEEAAGGLYFSTTSWVAISLEKPDSSSTGYKFYITLARADGPDIGGTVPGESTGEQTQSSSVIIGASVAGVIVFIILIIAAVYFVYIYRRKKEDKELKKTLAASRSTLFPSDGTIRGGSSVHSSVHSSHHSTHNTLSVYPAFRTKPSISDKAPKCNSIDTLTNSEVEGDSVFNETDGTSKPKPVRDVKREFDSMRRGLLRDKHREEMQQEDLRQQERSRQEARNFDRQGRAESNKGFGRANRERSMLTAENLKGSLREARSKGRPLTESHSRSHKDSGSVRSSRSKNRSHSPARSAHSAFEYRDEYDSYSDDYRQRDRTRSNNGRSRPRSSSTSSNRRRDHYADSDYEERRGYHSRDRLGDRSRDRYDDGYDSHRSGQRSTRSRSQSSGRRHR